MGTVDYGAPDDPLNAPDHSAWSGAVHAELVTLADQLAGHTHTDLVGPPPVLVDGVTVTVPPGTPADLDVIPTGVYGEYRVDAEIPQGIQGEVGPNGPPLNILGSVASVDLLPPSANVGDAYVITDPDPDEIYAWGSNGWVRAGALTGTMDHGTLTGLGDDDHTQYAGITVSTSEPTGAPSRDGLLWFVIVEEA